MSSDLQTTYKIESFIATGDCDWNELVQDIIVEKIKEGYPPEAAVLKAGITKNKFDHWWTDKSFRDWTKALQLEHFAQTRANLVKNIDSIESYAAKSDRQIKYLEHVDPDFNTKNTLAIEAKRPEDDDDDTEYDAMIAKAHVAQEQAQLTSGVQHEED